MNIRRRWFAMALLVCFAVVVAVAAPATLAYMVDRSETVVNSFVYYPPTPASVQVNVHKIVRPTGDATIGPEDFHFRLQKVGGEAIDLFTDEQGYGSATLTFTKDDLDKEHVYHLRELNDYRGNMTYSDKVYEIRITLDVDAENRIIVSMTVDGKPVNEIMAEFVNIYHSPLPLTGDAAAVELWLAMMTLSGAGMLLICRRKRSA